jgi:hypothetical protein
MIHVLQAADTATAVGNAAGMMLAAGAKATTAGSQALQRAVGTLVGCLLPDSPAKSSCQILLVFSMNGW